MDFGDHGHRDNKSPKNEERIEMASIIFLDE